MPLNLSQLVDDLILDESLENKPYRDTKGKLTIGIGRNLDDSGINDDEARMLCDNDIRIAMDDLDRNCPWWRELPEPAARALTNMCFNMGWPGLSTFRKMLAALERGDFIAAADQALDSKWAREDVGEDRSGRIADLYRMSANP